MFVPKNSKNKFKLAHLNLRQLDAGSPSMFISSFLLLLCLLLRYRNALWPWRRPTSNPQKGKSCRSRVSRCTRPPTRTAPSTGLVAPPLTQTPTHRSKPDSTKPTIISPTICTRRKNSPSRPPYLNRRGPRRLLPLPAPSLNSKTTALFARTCS